MTESKALQRVADIFSDKSVTLTFAVTPSKWIEKQFIRYGLKADQKTYHLPEFLFI